MIGVHNRPINAHIIVHYKTSPEQHLSDDHRAHNNYKVIRTMINVGNDHSPHPDSDNPLVSFATPRRYERRLSNSMKVCDLYQCVHHHSHHHHHHHSHSPSHSHSNTGVRCRPSVRRLSESNVDSDSGFDLGGNKYDYDYEHNHDHDQCSPPIQRSPINRTVSYAADNDQHLTYLPTLPPVKPPITTCSLNDPRSVFKDFTFSDAAGAQPRFVDGSAISYSSSASAPPSSSSSSSSSSSEADTPTHLCSLYEAGGEPRSRSNSIDLSSPCTRHHHRRNSVAVKFDKALYKKV